jgi:O-antigen/teichoic acid export membrane protein
LPGLIKSALILSFARITNFALVFFSPIFLVRILEPTSFGQYREFIAYSLIVTNLAAFSINTNLLYFIPRHPDNTKLYVSHTNWLKFGASILACAILWVLGDQIRSNTSFDFVLPLIFYVLLFANVTFLEYYWIATKQPTYVFYYSTARTIARMGAVVGTAWLTRSISAILIALIVVEAIRLTVVLAISLRSRLLSFPVKWTVMRQQLGFIMPLGIATSLNQLHQYVGQIVISAQLGVIALAVYSVASYKVPIVRIARGAVGDAIFPDMVGQAASDEGDKLRLWKRGNIAYSCLIVPMFFVLFWYADVLIPLVFTDKYVEAVPIFRILLLIMPLEAIEMNSPLRAANRTTDLLLGNLVLLTSNLVCIFVFFRYFPEIAIQGPAVGIVIGLCAERIFMAWRITRFFKVSLGDLLKWRSQAAIYICVAISALVLFLGELLPLAAVTRLLLFSVLYLATYYTLLRYFKLEEVVTVERKLARKLQRLRS